VLVDEEVIWLQVAMGANEGKSETVDQAFYDQAYR